MRTQRLECRAGSLASGITAFGWCLVAWLSSACAQTPPTLTVYSGRSEALIGPLIERYEKRTGVEVRVHYGGSAQLAAMIVDEGEDAAADVYFGQDPGALGVLAREGRLKALPDTLLEQVDSRFRAKNGRWIGTSGRARVLAYNTTALDEEELPDTIHELTDPRWNRRIGWAPENGSFQAFVTAMRAIEGDERTREWLAGMVANEPRVYRDNTPLFQAVIDGEIDIGLTNHYYLMRFLQDAEGGIPVRNYSPRGGGAGALVNIAGAGIVGTSPHPDQALDFIEFLLSEEAQTYFAEHTFEYPLIEGIAAPSLVAPLSEIRSPDVDLGGLGDLQGTLAMLHEVGAI